jgi:hypothetical protein
MQLISFGNFYLGLDKESYTDALVHIGRLRLEWECRPRSNGPLQTPAHQPTDGANAKGHGPTAPVGP